MFDLGTEDGIDAAYQARGAALHRLALRVLRDRGLAEEAVQETFVRAWRAAHTFQPDGRSQEAWLYAICRNTCFDLYRQRRIRPSLATRAEVVDHEGRAAVDDVDRAMGGWLLDEALGRLAPEHRSALVGAHVEGRPYDDLADELGVPVGTVKSRVFYGLQALRRTLVAMGWHD